MPWDSNDYKAVLLVGAIIVVAVIVGIYIATQWKATQPPLEFKGEPASTSYSTTSIISDAFHIDDATGNCWQRHIFYS
jgi:hypothetical protein